MDGKVLQLNLLKRPPPMTGHLFCKTTFYEESFVFIHTKSNLWWQANYTGHFLYAKGAAYQNRLHCSIKEAGIFNTQAHTCFTVLWLWFIVA